MYVATVVAVLYNCTVVQAQLSCTAVFGTLELYIYNRLIVVLITTTHTFWLNLF